MVIISWREAERIFNSSGTCRHVYSTPLESGFFFENDEERKFALLLIALAAADAGVTILAYAIMTNHFHFIVIGDRWMEFFLIFKERFSTYLSRHGRQGLMKKVFPKETEINSLKQFYNELVYVIRNPYVVSPEVNLLSYPWCSGYLYFNSLIDLIPSRSAVGMSYRELRQITKSRDTTLPEWVRITEGAINPACFVDYKLVEKLFRSPQEFLAMCFRNVEAQIEVAQRMEEKPVLKDEEMFRLIRSRINDKYGATDFLTLSLKDRTEVLKYMKYELASSNGQIARVLNRPQSEIDAIFPLTAKNPVP